MSDQVRAELLEFSEELFWSRVDKTGPNGCWLWTSYIGSNGYGKFTTTHWSRGAHRVAYELAIGTIPQELQLDHLCRVRHCVNPKHLEVVTAKENTLRGNGLAAQNAKKTHCPQNHPYDSQNTGYRKNGRSRACKECHRRETAARKAHRLEHQND